MDAGECCDELDFHEAKQEGIGVRLSMVGQSKGTAKNPVAPTGCG